ncbi:glycosyltransferase family 5 protein [Calocera viscosa TUFC12733]|uniref:alpha-1,3-glucan synthase n=1 Tax=Calocera viscosa (strain TUFC12733) TaxID=1330018 RepID=A0A167LMV2_CALVF|nr:glycosyltransferase family 5 protein [Calocera viscosa TUFC12733]
MSASAPRAGCKALLTLLTLFLLAPLSHAIQYYSNLTEWNLNTAQGATSVPDYDTNVRANTTYTPSPANWRSLPVYTILLDKFADGVPDNNDYFKTMYENDWRETGLRYGGDLKGLQNRLDYLQGMGVKVIYIAGTVFLNMPWQADSYSPIDFTLVDPHWGNITDWINTIDMIHARGMYIMSDFTIGTLGDMVGFVGYENVSAPFDIDEYQCEWKNPQYVPFGLEKYPDFEIVNTYNESCQLPVLWQDDGTIVNVAHSGCYESDFDQYGDMEAFGVHPDWQRQLSKFASVQDRLREWNPNVMAKLQSFPCLVMKAFDIDAIRIDKSTQVTVDALTQWTSHVRQCAAALGKNNFYIGGEVTGGDTFGALYIGRGRTPSQRTNLGFFQAGNITSNMSEYFLRDIPYNGLDGDVFHYSVYRALTRMLGMDGNLEVAYDVSTNFVTMWNEFFVNDDFINPNTGLVDPKHMFGVSNFDVFRWPGLVNGTARLMLGTFITTMVMPGIPLLYYGEEQDFYVFDNGAANYLYGRQPMSASVAWQRHGCYKLGSQQYYYWPLEKAMLSCQDDWVSRDHFDPTSPSRRLISRMYSLRDNYPLLVDGFNLVQLGNWTYFIQRPGSNETQTEMGLWSTAREAIPGMPNQVFNGNDAIPIWNFYSNNNVTTDYTYDCADQLWISAPYMGNTTVRNLFAPYESYALENSNSPYYLDGNPPYRGCLPSITLEPFGFKSLVPSDIWYAPRPMMTKFIPGHDNNVIVWDSTASNATTVPIRFEFNVAMNPASITQYLGFDVSGINGGTLPTVDASTVNSGTVTDPDPAPIQGLDTSAWFWSANLVNVPDGVITLTLNNMPTEDGTASTGVTDHLVFRKGQPNNVLIDSSQDYDNDAFGWDGSEYTFTHKAIGADLVRYTWNYGQNWSDWQAYQNVTTMPAANFEGQWWSGNHVIMQYFVEAVGSSTYVVHADRDYSGGTRRVPQFLARGPYNNWGYDQGLTAEMTHNADGTWELEIMAQWPTYVQLNVFGYDNYFYGDIDGDGIMDRGPPNSAAPTYLNFSAPPYPHLAWALVVNDQDMSYWLEPRGYSIIGAIMFALLLGIPLITGILAVLIFKWSFYGIRHNRWGVKPTHEGHSNYFPIVGGSFNKKDNEVATPMAEKSFGRPGHSSMKPPGRIIGWPEDTNKRRKVLIATLEYEIFDWKLKVKIGGLGVMSGLMGKAMSDVDLIWVIPKVKDLEYPTGDFMEPIEVVIFGQPYLIEVETHQLDNITYVILDSPVFRAQTRADPYPARMDDLGSAIFYSTWNQAIADTIRRFPGIDIYHVNDYHGALAPLYLLPKVMPICLSLHNAEFQGLWPLRTKEEMKEVCSAFNLSKEVCTKYVQFGNTFNLLHAAASYISTHQKSTGVAGVSDSYGKRSWARYPALWTLKHVDSLPNPDPTDIEALDLTPVDMHAVTVDLDAESKRPEDKRQAQEWAGIGQDPNADLFVFVGRWSKQKGVDLIADVMPSLLSKRKSVQLIAVGPVIDLYGRFAAEKLARLMEMYPDRVYSKPEFTALPPFIFSGADFALIPSRDEPFGLVAVEFGRKGALGVGSRLGGLGLMPGWWFPVESMSTGHMLSQLSKTIKLALKSTEEERAILRARSAVQRFPVVEWRQRMEDFHRRSIGISRSLAGADAWSPTDCVGGELNLPQLNLEDNRRDSLASNYDGWDAASPVPPSPGSLTPGGQGQYLSTPFIRPQSLHRQSSFNTDGSADEQQSFQPDAPHSPGVDSADGAGSIAQSYDDFLSRANKQIAKQQGHVGDPFLQPDGVQPNRPFGAHSRVSSVESIASIIDEKANSPLNKAIDSFTDSDGEVAQAFVQKLQLLTPENSKNELSIERYLQKSEEAFFDKVRKDKINYASSVRSGRDSTFGAPTLGYESHYDSRPTSPNPYGSTASFQHHLDYEAPPAPDPDAAPMTRLQIALAREIGGWPLYTIIIATGQMLGATSFQITLLSGQNWQTNLQLYVLGGVFLAASIVWYTLFRLKPSFYVLAAPWIFYGLAFFLIGLPSVSDIFTPSRDILSSVATWCYAVSSAAAFLFFGLNFGEEAGAATEVWTMRACVVQGSQQIWIAALWYWGNSLNGVLPTSRPDWWIVLILWPLAVMSFFFSYCMFFGLPDYYHQTPPKVPNFLRTLFRRKIVLWFLASEVLRDYWLSGPYGRNWAFLWSSTIPQWATLILVVFFFIGVWALMLFILTYFAKTHTWLLPVFAVGLGAPRWCQMMWGTSSLALYIPWAGAAGPYLGTSLWLWLGVLDAIQGVGLGMILLQTLSRLHVCATLAFAQVIGCVCVMVARATAPDQIGPGSVFPDASTWDFSNGIQGSPMASAPFWVAMICQLVIVGGYFLFYRKEQLSRP